MTPIVEKMLMGLAVPALVSAASVVAGWNYVKEDVTETQARVKIIEQKEIEKAKLDGRTQAILEQIQSDVKEIKTDLKALR